MYLELNEKQACLNKLVCSVENFLWFYSVNFKIHIIYDFRVSILKSYISWMVGPIFNLFFLKCSFGRPFVRLDDRSFVWTIVYSFGRNVELNDPIGLLLLLSSTSWSEYTNNVTSKMKPKIHIIKMDPYLKKKPYRYKKVKFVTPIL